MIFLYSQGFTEIHTPKIGAKGAEGGANMFQVWNISTDLQYLAAESTVLQTDDGRRV